MTTNWCTFLSFSMLIQEVRVGNYHIAVFIIFFSLAHLYCVRVGGLAT